jgi:hypothetical protein
MPEQFEDLKLDPNLVEAVFEELGELNVALDADPLVYGPKRLNGKVAELRAMLSRCETLFLQMSQEKHRFQRAFRVISVALELSKKKLFDTDPEVRAGRSQGDRDAIATGKLLDVVKESHRLELAVQDIDAVLIVIKAKRSDLRDTEGRLRDQMRLCSEEIGLGGRWGARVPNAPELQPGQGQATGADIDAVEALLEDLNSETHLPPLEDEDEDEDEVQVEETGEETGEEAQEEFAEERPSLGAAWQNQASEASEAEASEASEAEASEASEASEADPPRESPLFETSSEGNGESSKVLSETASAEDVDVFLDSIQGETDEQGHTRIEPIPNDVIESLFDAFD